MWQVIGASSIGTSHVKSKTPCQDANGFRVLSDSCVVAVAADGLGSAARAEEGATIAVQSALDILSAMLQHSLPDSMDAWLDTLLDAFVEVRGKLEAHASAAGAPLRDFGTTLLAAAVTDTWLAVGHIGDGAVVARFAGGAMETVSPPLRGEYANETTPLTAVQWMECAFCSVYRVQTQAVALFTDGLQNQSLDSSTGAPFSPFFEPFFDAVTRKIDTGAVSLQLRKFLESERVCSKTDDDKTLVVIGRLASSETPALPPAMSAG